MYRVNYIIKGRKQCISGWERRDGTHTSLRLLGGLIHRMRFRLQRHSLALWGGLGAPKVGAGVFGDR